MTTSGTCHYVTLMIITNEQTNNYTNKRAIGLKPGTTWSPVEHSTTAAMGKEGMIHEFSSFHTGN